MESHGVTLAQSETPSPRQLPVGEFIDGLRTITEGLITKQKIYDYLAHNEIRPEDLDRYINWIEGRHARNKIFRNDEIEVMLICWPVGAITPLHTHNGQLGWMTMLQGKLVVENYRKLGCDKPENQNVVGIDCLAGATRIAMEHIGNEIAVPSGPVNTVDKLQTIHRISNLKEWDEPAISMHIYSRPIDSCVVFDMEAQHCYRRDLKYDFEP